jgi:hypothetical protein
MRPELIPCQHVDFESFNVSRIIIIIIIININIII